MTATHLTPPPATTPGLYEQDGKGYDAIVHAHYFVGGCDWLITEYDPASGRMFGWACINDRQNTELGYINHHELDAVRVNAIVPIDDDTDWQPATLTAAIHAIDTRAGRTVKATR